jgi:hypothetical protein
MINIITSFYLLKNKDERSQQRNNELCKTLINNNNNKLIKKIYLFIDDEYASNKLLEIGINMGKIYIIRIGPQPLYSELFEYAIDNLKDEICMITNSDIFLYECDTDCLLRLSNNIFALTRYEHDLSCPNIDNNCGLSHDVFIFKSPLNKNILNGMKHIQNVWGSEATVIISLIENGGYKLYNPCYQMKIVHLHESELRDVGRPVISTGKYRCRPCYF